MSDSESVSSEPSPPNSGAASPEPETEQPNPEETRQKEKSGVQGTPEPIDADVKPPLVESDGVRLSWPDPSGFVDEPAEDGPIASFDYVFVPGIYGNHQDGEEAGPDSRSSSWAVEYVKQAGRNDRILKFEYAAKTLFSGVKCRQAIRSCALQLLRGVLALRRDAKRRRLIAFIAFDLGGILVKDALVAAVLDPGAWPDVADMSRILIFCGCPQRSTGYLDMEHRLCRFVYESSTKAVSDVTPSASSIAGLAAATIEVNGLFVDSKASLRCRIISVHAGPPLTDKDTTAKRISSVFDNYGGTLGVPFEKRFVLTGSDGSEITSYLDGLGSVLDANYTAEAMSYERKLLSVASPIDPFRSAASVRDSSSAVTETSAYKTWIDLPGPQILYIHGPQGARDAAEQVFYALDAMKHTEDTIVLYFSFDQGDVRRDSIRDMASTFMAQIICQFPHNADWTDRLFTQLDLERGWTEADLIYWLERFRFNNDFEHAIYVINHFDECTKGSQQFLQKFKYLSANSEGQWKIVLTSHKPGALLGELSDTALTTLDLSTSTDSKNSSAETEGEIKQLMHSRPELLLQESLVRRELAEIAGIDPLARRLVITQAGTQPDWPNRLSVRILLEPLNSANDSQWEDSILASLLDRLLRSVKERVPTLRLLLSWLLYTVRPLTIWELGTVLYLDSSADKNVAVPPASAMSHLIGNIQVWLAGIVEVDHNEVRLSHPRLRNILMSKVGLSGKEGNKSPRNVHVWDDISATAHFDIARQCLNYLSQPEVRDIVDRTGSFAGVPVHVFADRGNLCSYALQAWTYHFLKASPADQTKLASQFEFSRLGRSWARGYWALSNPVTRNKKPLDSLFPVFAGLGLCNAVKPRDKDDLSCGIVEAASKGHSQTVKRLIKHNTLSEETLLEVLVAAGASGDDGLILSLIQHISSKSNSPDAVVWPTSLLYRAAWLGLDRVIESLLQLGVGADPGHPIREKLNLSPLYQAIRNFHVAAVRVLISAGADVSFRAVYGRTALHLAAQLGNAEIAGLLVHEGKSDIESQDDSKITPLYLACLYGHHAVAKELLLLGADPNMGLTTENPDKMWTPLIVAAEGGFHTCTKLLIENKVSIDLNGPTTDGTALRHAVIKGQAESCELLLEGGANPNSPFINTPLIVQLVQYIGSERQEKRVQILKLLLDKGVNVNAKGEDSQATIVSLLNWDDIGPFYEVVLNHPGVDVNVLNTENETPLHSATLNKHLAAVELLLAHGADVNRVSSGGFTPLYNAIPKPELVGALLKAGANPSISKYGGFTCLMYAAWSEVGNEESLKLLLEHNVALETECSNDVECTGWTALTCALATGYAAAVRHLVEAGANLKHVGADGIPILHHAASTTIDPTGKLAIVLEYLTRLDLNQTDKHGRTALHLTSIPVENLKRLINAGADVNILDEEGQTPLNSDNISVEATELLLKHGADPNILAPAYGGPLHRSARGSNFQMAKLLVENEAVDVNAAAPSMCGTPLMSACLCWQNYEDHVAEIVQLLLSRGADVNGKGGLFGYALNAAAFLTGPAVIDILIANKASTDVKDDLGRRPAHFAAMHNVETFQKVVDIGCDVGKSDITGRTTLMWAAPPGNVETAKKLLDMTPDSDIDTKDQDGWTALCWAARGPRVYYAGTRTAGDPAEFIKLLLERGADKRVVVTGPGGERWTPLKIARFHAALPEVVELLKGEGESGPEDGSKVGGNAAFACDGCCSIIFGFRYGCKTCHWFDLCFKCYPHRKELHLPGDHEFEENGPEFEEEADSERSEDSS
ncbi:ankyrin repeat-containing domain protein [Rhypophila decipiens]|uniref:Ankyrin repeat-containing domain protein n=1 Tax=Rhypophila decipiens TaxID=261697 RepID=A0AAN7B417_9PEZI|nr:ankyrin repeat-containing domain protein [Rhypophila decipiens]